ncbi:MAG: hypothetical protein ABEH90_00180 [Halolamina sp.]
MKLRLSAVIGALAVLTGLLFIVRREFAAAISLEWTFVVLVAVIAGVQALRFVQTRRQTPLEATETADPERRYDAPTPGDDADEALGVARGWSRRGRRLRKRLRERAGDAATAAIMDVTGCSHAEAARRVRTGEWTDDPVAAWFLSDSVELPPKERLRMLVGSPLSRFGTAFDRTVRAVEALSGGEEP